MASYPRMQTLPAVVRKKVLFLSVRREGYHALIACLTEPNEGSTSLHTKLGFQKVSHFKEVGLKFGRWLDVSDYELIL